MFDSYFKFLHVVIHVVAVYYAMYVHSWKWASTF